MTELTSKQDEFIHDERAFDDIEPKMYPEGSEIEDDC